MATIQRKVHRKAGSHNGSKIYSAMLKRVESEKCTIPIRHFYEAVPKIHIDASIPASNPTARRHRPDMFYTSVRYGLPTAVPQGMFNSATGRPDLL